MTDIRDDATIILSFERTALDRWGKGDPDGYLEIYDTAATYFDPFCERRVDGLKALAERLGPVRGRISIKADEMLDAHVQIIGDVAILSFSYRSLGSEGSRYWHCTEVYRRNTNSWNIIHTHWSLPTPNIP